MTTLKTERIGSIDLYILPVEGNKDDIESLDTNLVPTAERESPSLKEVLSNLRLGLLDNLNDNISTRVPKEIKVEFSIAFSEKANGWIIGFQGDQKIGVTMTWKAGE